MDSKIFVTHKKDNSQHQKNYTDKWHPSVLVQPYAPPSHPMKVGVNSLNEAVGDIIIVLESLIRGHKCFYESNHLDSDKDETTNVDPPEMDLYSENTVTVTSTFSPDNSLGWIGIHKEKGKKDPWLLLGSSPKMEVM